LITLAVALATLVPALTAVTASVRRLVAVAVEKTTLIPSFSAAEQNLVGHAPTKVLSVGWGLLRVSNLAVAREVAPVGRNLGVVGFA